MGVERTLLLKLLGDTAGIDKSLKGTQRRLAEVKKWTKAVALDALITGVEAVTDAIGEAWTGFREGEKASAQLGTTWRNLGLDGSRLSGTIQAISDSTLKLGTDDTEAIMAFNRALQNTGGKPAQAMKRLRIAQDLVANGSAPNLNSALKLISQAAKGSARVVDQFGLKGKTAGARIDELGNKVRGAARKAAKADPFGVLENQINEHLEGIVGAISKGELNDALGELEGIGTDVSAAWDKVGPAVTGALDKMTGGAFSEFVGKLQALGDKFLPKVREGFGALAGVLSGLQGPAQSALDAIQPLVDAFSSSAEGGLAFVLDAVNGAMSTVASLLRGDFETAFSGASETVGKLGEDLNQALLGIPQKLLDAVVPIGAAALAVGQEILNKVIDNANLIPKYLVNILVGEDGIVGKLTGAVGAIGDAAGGIGKAIFDGITGLLGDIAEKVQGVLDDINKALGGVAQLGTVGPNRDGSGSGGGGVGGHGGGVPNRYGPGGGPGGGGHYVPLAAGGIVTRPTLAMIGEGRHHEAVIPLDGRHGLGGSVYNINVMVAPGGDLAEAGRQTVAAIKAYERRDGKGWRSR